MKTDYPELEGKEITYHDGKRKRTCKVSGCNYHVGVSIEDKDKYLLCLNGTKSPNYKKYCKPMPRNNYRRLFHFLVKQIQKGYIDARILVNHAKIDTGNHPTADDCPYAQ